MAGTTVPCWAEEESITRKVVAIPLRTAGCFFALTLGTPIAIGRISKKRYQEHVDDAQELEGGKGNVIYAIPMGIGEGFAHGIYYGPRNAIANFNKPFSKAALSLGAEI